MSTSQTETRFASLAVPMISRGIAVIPVEPEQKRCLLAEWPSRASTDAAQITAWAQDYPAHNIGCMANAEVCILDCDVPTLPETIESETGKKIPLTFTVTSAGRGAPHLYFKHTERSRAIGNRSGAELFDFKADRSYVVGPGSTLRVDGELREYRIASDAELVELPDWLCDWIAAKADAPKQSSAANTADVVETFDINAFLQHYGLGYVERDDYYVTDVCPVAGHKHRQSTETGFYYDGQRFGFSCFAANCDGSRMTVGQVIKHLNKTHPPYSGPIWREDEWDLPSYTITGRDGRGLRVFVSEAERTKWIAENIESLDVTVKPAREVNGNCDPDNWRGLFHTYEEIENAPELTWAINGFIQEAGITFFGGPAGHGKTLIMLNTARALLECEPLFGHFHVPCPSKRILYLIPESGLTPFVRRLKMFRLLPYAKDGRFYCTTLSAQVDHRTLLTDKRLLKAADGADVFLDTAVRFMSGDENSAADQRGFADVLFALQKAGARTIIGAHHSPKAFDSKNRQEQITLESAMRGSGDIGAMLATAWAVKQVDGARNRLFVKNVKPRDFEPCAPFEIEGRPWIDETGAFKMVAEPGKAAKPQKRNNTEKIEQARHMQEEGKTTKEISDAVGIGERQIRNWRRDGLLPNAQSLANHA